MCLCCHLAPPRGQGDFPLTPLWAAVPLSRSDPAREAQAGASAVGSKEDSEGQRAHTPLPSTQHPPPVPGHSPAGATPPAAGPRSLWPCVAGALSLPDWAKGAQGPHRPCTEWEADQAQVRHQEGLWGMLYPPGVVAGGDHRGLPEARGCGWPLTLSIRPHYTRGRSTFH